VRGNEGGREEEREGSADFFGGMVARVDVSTHQLQTPSKAIQYGAHEHRAEAPHRLLFDER
jgi:hypothetical protein